MIKILLLFLIKKKFASVTVCKLLSSNNLSCFWKILGELNHFINHEYSHY